jgi:hypothetical protein
MIQTEAPAEGTVSLRFVAMTFDTVFGLLLALAALAYCTYAMLRPEKF